MTAKMSQIQYKKSNTSGWGSVSVYQHKDLSPVPTTHVRTLVLQLKPSTKVAQKQINPRTLLVSQCSQNDKVPGSVRNPFPKTRIEVAWGGTPDNYLWPTHTLDTHKFTRTSLHSQVYTHKCKHMYMHKYIHTYYTYADIEGEWGRGERGRGERKRERERDIKA